jgi:pantoate--beta-alanine ligase
VAQVVKRFLEIIQPDKAFFGSKDYQQVLIVKALVKQMGIATEIVPCPILREPDGLAMSSRNALLSREERVIASNIPVLMEAASHIVISDTVDAARKYIKDQLGRFPETSLVYYEVCDAASLRPLTQMNGNAKTIALIAVVIGKIRLIDNMPLN